LQKCQQLDAVIEAAVGNGCYKSSWLLLLLVLLVF